MIRFYSIFNSIETSLTSRQSNDLLDILLMSQYICFSYFVNRLNYGIRYVSGELRYNSTNSDIVRSLRAIASIIAITAVVSIEDRLFNLC
jgi:hypothetical protein